jgi:thioredoxin reductase
VHLIIRRDALHASMSRYLVDRIERNPGIVVWPSTHVTALTGTDKLEAVRLGREGQPGNLRSSRNRVVRLPPATCAAAPSSLRRQKRVV